MDGLRCTLITEREDFSARTALAESLPDVMEGEEADIITDEAAVCYDPFFSTGSILEKWKPLIFEWQRFLQDEELRVLAEIWDGVHWRRLVGLGPGSTPAGDDFLHGRLTAHIRRFMVEDSVVRDFRNGYRPGSTVKLSESFYEDLLLRKLWRRGKSLLEALPTDDPQKVISALNGLIRWGHSSGRAWLAGFAFGVEEICNSTQ